MNNDYESMILGLLIARVETLEQKIADLEGQVQSQQIKIELTHEFCRSVAHKNGMSLLSYQQLNSPSADSSEKIRMLLQQIREF